MFCTVQYSTVQVQYSTVQYSTVQYSTVISTIFFPFLLEPSDPQDAEVANMYLSNYERFLSTARFWTESYAMPSEAVAGAEVQSISISSPPFSIL
jgi:ubiquitin-protein ligase